MRTREISITVPAESPEVPDGFKLSRFAVEKDGMPVDNWKPKDLRYATTEWVSLGYEYHILIALAENDLIEIYSEWDSSLDMENYKPGQPGSLKEKGWTDWREYGSGHPLEQALSELQEF